MTGMALATVPEWDVLMIGDGSGTGGWTMGAGWSCFTMVRNTTIREQSWGAINCGSIILAELAAYFFAWQVFEAKHGVMTRERLGRPYNVAVLTDNQPITQQAARAMGGAYVRGDSGPIWAGLVAGLKQIGSSMSFHFIPRMSIELNWAADKLCGQAREALCAEEVGTVTKRRVVVDVNKLNPA